MACGTDLAQTLQSYFTSGAHLALDSYPLSRFIGFTKECEKKSHIKLKCLLYLLVNQYCLLLVPRLGGCGKVPTPRSDAKWNRLSSAQPLQDIQKKKE